MTVTDTTQDTVTTLKEQLSNFSLSENVRLRIVVQLIHGMFALSFGTWHCPFCAINLIHPLTT